MLLVAGLIYTDFGWRDGRGDVWNGQFQGLVYDTHAGWGKWTSRRENEQAEGAWGYGGRGIEWIYYQVTEPWMQPDERRKPQETLSLTVGNFSFSLSIWTLFRIILSLSLPSPLPFSLSRNMSCSPWHGRFLFPSGWKCSLLAFHGIVLVPKHYQLVDKAVWWLSFQPKQISFGRILSFHSSRGRLVYPVDIYIDHEIFRMKRDIFETRTRTQSPNSSPPSIATIYPRDITQKKIVISRPKKSFDFIPCSRYPKPLLSRCQKHAIVFPKPVYRD